MRIYKFIRYIKEIISGQNRFEINYLPVHLLHFHRVSSLSIRF
jgi:hypothetical protein